jgi:threonine/homoserine/homoserine lactone efflux protein
MLGIHHYWLFIFSGILLILTPGQDTMYILGRSLTGGLRSGVASAFGITVGTITHTLAAAAGLSVLLAASPVAFMTVKLCGAAYLLFLGVRLLFTRSTTGAERDPPSGSAPGSTWSVFSQGVLSSTSSLLTL